MTAPLSPQILRRRPQLAAVEVLTSVLETTLVALSSAHPLIELDLKTCAEPVFAGDAVDDRFQSIELDLKTCAEPVLPIDRLADRAAEQAVQLLDALDRYRLAQYDLEHARHAPSQPREENVF